ncbi:MAG: hypothetical protein ACFE88_09015 [Candidatus Hermodarchaeota archaeon]
MPKKYIVIIKTIGRSWFIILVAIIIIVAIYNPIAAIWMSGITLVLFLLSYVPRLFFKNKIHKFMKKFYKIEDELIARKFNKPIKKIQEELFELSQNQEKKPWLVAFLNKQYVFYHQKTIEKFIELYNKGYSEKEILDNLKNFKVVTKAEIKTIKESLIKLNRLSEREISVKERRDQQRFA